MSHEIYKDNYVGSEAAWHRLGRVIGEDFTAEHLVQEMDFDYEVKRFPCT